MEEQPKGRAVRYVGRLSAAFIAAEYWRPPQTDIKLLPVRSVVLILISCDRASWLMTRTLALALAACINARAYTYVIYDARLRPTDESESE